MIRKKTAVLITGGSGLIGTHLSKLLSEKGFHVRHLTRKIKTNYPYEQYEWDIDAGIVDSNAFADIDYIIHLAGAGVAEKPWTEAYKKEILESRVKSAGLLFQHIKNRSSLPNAFISASGTGYYGDTGENICSEKDAAGTDFLSQVSVEWEKAAEQFNSLGIRTVMVRTPLVLERDGGGLPQMAAPVKYFVGAILGTGKQYLPWIHIDDLCAFYLHAIIDETVRGPFNVSAPELVNNKQFTQALGNVLNRPILLPNIPGKLLNWIFGDKANLLLSSSGVRSEKISQTGFIFRFPTLKEALTDLLK